jgi:hypothetical protein
MDLRYIYYYQLFFAQGTTCGCEVGWSESVCCGAVRSLKVTESRRNRRVRDVYGRCVEAVQWMQCVCAS